MKTILLILLITSVGGASSFAQSCKEGVFLGRLSANPYGQYGSAYSSMSANNPFALEFGHLLGAPTVRDSTAQGKALVSWGLEHFSPERAR